MPKRDIVLITLDYPPERGGVARYLGNLVAHARDRIRVIVPEGHAIEGPGRVEVRKLFRSAWPHWWPMVHLCRHSNKNVPDGTFLLVSHVFPVGTAAWISRMFGGPEYAVIMHGLDVRLARSAWKRWLLRRICRNAKVVIANSEATKTEVLELVRGLSIHVITPALEDIEVPDKADARRELNLDPNGPLVVSVARLVSRKGIDVALEAIARVQRQHDVSYAVIGDGPDFARLEQIATDSRTSVMWIQDADDRTKWLWLAAADVFLLPVRDDARDVEGFGIVFLEAARAGIPSVAGWSGGVPEAVRHERTGLLVNSTNVKQVAQAVERLLKDEELRAHMGMEGRRRVLKDFRWEDRVVTLLHEIDT